MTLLDLIRERIPWDHFSDTELQTLLPMTAHTRYGLVKRAIAKGQLVHLRRGLYCLAERYRRRPLNLLVVAQKIYGPSYISCESALSHHGWIPEGVFTVTSASMKRAQVFQSPLGLFSYERIRAEPFLTSVGRVTADGESYFLARPWRAVADYIFARRLDWRGVKPLVESLRIEEELLQQVDVEELTNLEMAFKAQRVTKFLKAVRKDLHL